jgi:LmbE family N-acetylglucosaminyl deacetylase
VRERGLPVTFGDPEATDPPEFGTPDDLITTRIDVRPYVQRKIDALRAHRTQIKRDSAFLSLPDDLARDYLGVEGFRRAQSRVEAPDEEDDLLAGLRSAEPVSGRR